MVQCQKKDCYLELFEKDVVDTELDQNGDETKVYRCPKCFTIMRWTD